MPSSGTGSPGAFSAVPEGEKGASKGETCSFMGHCSDRGKLDHQNQQESLFLLLLSLLAGTSPKAALLPPAGSLESRRAGPLMAILQHWPQAGQTSAPASRHWVCFHHLTAMPLSTAFLKALHYYFLHLKASVMLSRRYIHERNEVYLTQSCCISVLGTLAWRW